MKIKTGAGSLTMTELAGYTGGGLLGDGGIDFEYICTDSREAAHDTLFVALKGDRTDGHNYIPAAYMSGCRCFLVNNSETLPKGASAVICTDSESALMRLAAGCRCKVDCVRIGITGSVGKTTTKEFTAALLQGQYATHKTAGNYNSLIGMPLTMLETPIGTQMSVLEMAMSGQGEISEMSRAAQPDIAVITNIGTSHMEMLGSRENILRAKCEILDGMKPGSILIINGDDEMLSTMRNRNCGGVKIISVSLKDSDAELFADNIRYCGMSTVFDIKTEKAVMRDIKIPVIGEHNVYAALIATAIGGIIGMDEAAIRKGLAAYAGAGLRQEINCVGGVTVIEDCYNAGPESMKAALDVLNMIKKSGGGRTIALLGDMRELGASSAEYHREVGEYAAKIKIDMLFTLGSSSRYIAAGALAGGMDEDSIYVNVDENTYAATAWEIYRVLKRGDILLVKASRAVRAERVIECIKALTQERGF